MSTEDSSSPAPPAQNPAPGPATSPPQRQTRDSLEGDSLARRDPLGPDTLATGPLKEKGIMSTSQPKTGPGLKTTPGFDWRKKKAYPKCAEQGMCGAGYIFSVSGAIEIAQSTKLGQLADYSEQEVMDCGKNDGCKGGDIRSTFDFAEKRGLALESTSPFKGIKGTCNAKAKPAVKVKSYKQITGGASAMIKEIQTCPLVIGMNANFPGIQHYKSGILGSLTCDSKKLNYVAVVVGYETVEVVGKAPETVWIIRNNFGIRYGEDGHLRIKANICEIGSYAFKFTI